MLNTYIAEAVGSFIFFAIVLTKGDPIFISIALFIGILIASIGSQGHLNPAITAMYYMKGTNTAEESIGYVISQLVGAVIAVQWYNFYKK